MAEILLYLARNCTFLFRPGWLRFVDSRVDESFGGDAYVVLESTTLRLRFTRDRGQLLLSFQAIEGRASEWFSPGLLRSLLMGDRGGSEVLNEEWAAFLGTSLDELERRLNGPQREATLQGLHQAAKSRAKELFG
jgi:hypothetical protein